MESTLEKIAQNQKVIGEEIQRLLRNYKKDSAKRKDKNYLERRLTDLDAYWTDFSANHTVLEEKKSENPKHAYFEKDYYSQVEEVVKTFKLLLNDRLEEFMEENTASTSKDDKEKTNNENMNRIKLQRATARALVRTIGNIEAEQNEQHPKVYYREKIQLISTYWKNIFSNHMEIMRNATEADEEDDYIKNNYYDELQDRYQEALITLEAKCDTLYPMSDDTTRENAQPQLQEIKLPPVHIPKFDGDYYSWKSFQDLFIQLIHQNKSLGRAQKMQYLKANLAGGASKLLQHLQVTDSNYETAWELLNKRYDNKRLLVSTHLQKIIAQPQLQQETASELKRLHDTSKECLLAIQNLNVEIKNWDPLIVHILTSKLDKESYRQYENRIKNPKELQTLDDFFLFLEDRFQVLETLGDKIKKDSVQTKWTRSANLTKIQRTAKQSFKTCSVCKEKTHTIHTCTKFISMPTIQRREFAKQNNLCTNCLIGDHKTLDCRSSKTCRKCGRKHNTLLHTEAAIPARQQVNTAPTHVAAVKDTSRPNKEAFPYNWQTEPGNLQSYIGNKKSNEIKSSVVMLATALIQVSTNNGIPKIFRALIDQGSQTTLITEDAAQQLKAKRERIQINITGIGDTMAETARSRVHLTISPRFSSPFQLPVTAFVLTKLTNIIPGEQLPVKDWDHIQGLTLADPIFHKPGAIDMILGADYLAEILQQGLIKGRPGTPTAQKTELGWILFGNVRMNNMTCCVLQSNIDTQIKQFWEIEEIPKEKPLNDEEKACVKYFENTTQRSEDGTYTVSIPFNSRTDQILGESRPKAFARLMQMERKFSTNKALKKEYNNFMEEYLSLGHMKPADPEEKREVNKNYYLPHHAVINENSTTTRLRVVFDASAKTSTGVSLNDRLLTGPFIQQDITSILMRWRKHRIAISADIEKMYRQVKITEEDQNYHRILWRSNPNQPVKEYKLTTVTYGTKPASFLSTKTLQKLAMDEKEFYPKAAEIILKDFYVDDLLSGCDSVKEAKEIQGQVAMALSRGGFTLRKWASNSQALMNTIPEHLHSITPIQIDMDASIKTLGIHWSPRTDTFEVKVRLEKSTKPHTKRSLLSDVSKLFDPLGWMAPVIIKAKMMFQDLWLTGISWDQELPESIATEWHAFREELSELENIKIPRWIQFSKKGKINLIGFCDASEKAYAAVIYSRTTTASGEIKTSLIAAKTKVAPISKRVSLPRLELCGAVLLSNLMKQVKDAMELENIECQAYTDSTIVLAWIRGHPNKWKTFVANRVAEIHATLPSNQWQHVSSSKNPADVASRGINPAQLVNNQLWWTGPEWLTEIIQQQYEEVSTDLELRKLKVNITTVEENKATMDLLNQYSTFTKLKRVIAFCLRFIHNAKTATRERNLGPLKQYELKNAELAVIKLAQYVEFKQELTDLKKGKQLNTRSKLLPLSPMLDENEVIRVGGRLQNAEISYGAKHPIILPYKNPLTTLIIDMAHKKTMHGGISLTHAHLRSEYWIIKGHSAVKQFIHKCIICHRFNATTNQQLMGNLPKPRVTITKPFTNSGVDYAGPIDIRISKGRGVKSHKGYIVVFVCLSTKAIHLEIASDLTAEAFIAAFKRFVARRGHVTNLYSDNGTNFVLANKILQANTAEHLKKYFNNIQDAVSDIGTQWHFIPPSSPHFGGLWEAGVKAVKFHLKRVIRDTKLTFEEMSTVLAQIEACLNSRPLCPLKDSPNEIEVLTPGHFLVGAPLLAPPADDLLDKNIHSLKKWKLIDRMHQDFWKKWSEEYLTRLQHRPKWNTANSNVKPGDLVLIKGEQLPPTKWPLGRVIDTHPGSDKLVRVATIKTRNGTFKRPITKLCTLPLAEEENLQATQTEQSSPPQEEPRDISMKTQKPCNYHALASKFLKEASRARRQANPKKVKINPVTTDYKILVPPEEQRKASLKYGILTKRSHCDFNQSKPEGQEKIHQDQEQSNRAPVPKKVCKLGQVLGLLLIISLGPPTLGQEMIPPVEIKPFNTHPGLYFEELGKISIINSEWNIISYFNLDGYWQELEGLRQCVSEISYLCNKMTLRKFYCHEILAQFQYQLAQFEDMNEVLHNRSGSDQHLIRNRRSPLNLVGNVANKLFGILDSEYAIHIEEEIEKTKTNENHLLQLIKNQTSILESTVNILKKDETNIVTQFRIINDNLKALTKQIQEIDVKRQEQEGVQLLNSFSIHTSLVFQNYHRVQKNILDAVVDLQHGKINPLILTPYQLKKQLPLIKENIPPTLTVPDNEDNGEISIYKLMTAKTRVTKSKVIFSIKIPLVHNNHYQLFKLIPIPTPHNNSFIFIQPSSDYLIVNLHRDQYYPLNQRELDKCSEVTGYNYLCRQHHPIFNLNSNHSRCEMDLLNHKVSLSPECKFRITKPSKLWIQLHSPNTWLYILDREYTFNIICGTEVIPKVLRDDGILKLRSDCNLKQDSMVISGHSLYTTSLNSSFIPGINLTQHLRNFQFNQKNSTIPIASELYVKDNKEELVSLTHDLQDLKKNEELPQTINSHDIHHYAVSYLLITTGIAALFYFVYKKISSRKTIHLDQSANEIQQTPSPLPRTTVSYAASKSEDFVL